MSTATARTVENTEMDEELRELIELARTDAEYARLELGRLQPSISDPVLIHVQGLISRLDEILRRTHWSNASSNSKKH